MTHAGPMWELSSFSEAAMAAALPIDWARLVNATERTLLRCCQRDPGMSLAHWKQRLKVMHSLKMLRTGITIKTVAFDLGYSSSSAFISMFRKLTGETPDEYRRAKLAHPA